MIELLDDIFRFGAVFCSMLIAGLALRDARCSLAAYLAVGLSVCTTSFLIISAPGASDAVGYWGIPLEILALFSPGALWLFSLSLFDDNFRIERPHLLVAGVFWLAGASIFPAFYLYFGYWPNMSPQELHLAVEGLGGFPRALMFLSDALKFGMMAHMLYAAWQGRDDDLLEARRRFRSTFVIGGAAVVGVVVYSLSSSKGQPLQGLMWSDVAASGAILAIVFYLLWNVTRIDSEWLLGDLSQAETAPATALPQAEPTDALDLARLNDLAANATLLEQGLTITRLSEIAKVPEHRLRRLINQHMGFRNFSDFLNNHRIEAAKGRLANAQDRHTPVLTIAMELGYGSLGPFNRAFKERTGQTPTEFRSHSLAAEWVSAE